MDSGYAPDGAHFARDLQGAIPPGWLSRAFDPGAGDPVLQWLGAAAHQPAHLDHGGALDLDVSPGVVALVMVVQAQAFRDAPG